MLECTALDAEHNEVINKNRTREQQVTNGNDAHILSIRKAFVRTGAAPKGQTE